MYNKFINNYFIVLFSFFPIAIILGPAISLINILLIDLSFLFLIFYIREFSFLKNKAVKYLFLLYFYLLFNSLISIDPIEGIYRNFGFIRIIILFVAVNYFFNNKARSELKKEIRAQFKAFKKTGLKLDHVNAHNHMHLHPTIFNLIIESTSTTTIYPVKPKNSPKKLLLFKILRLFCGSLIFNFLI